MSGFKDILDKVPMCGDLWRQEVFVDPLTGISITKLTKTVLDLPKFMSVAQIQTNQGPVNLQFPIDAVELADAASKWQECARKAITDMDEQMREQQRRVIIAPASNLPRSH